MNLRSKICYIGRTCFSRENVLVDGAVEALLSIRKMIYFSSSSNLLFLKEDVKMASIK
jgi:hypothetical protein